MIWGLNSSYIGPDPFGFRGEDLEEGVLSEEHLPCDSSDPPDLDEQSPALLRDMRRGGGQDLWPQFLAP